MTIENNTSCYLIVDIIINRDVLIIIDVMGRNESNVINMQVGF